MTEIIAPFYTVVVFLKEVAVFAFFCTMIWAVIKTAGTKSDSNKKDA